MIVPFISYTDIFLCIFCMWTSHKITQILITYLSYGIILTLHNFPFHTSLRGYVNISLYASEFTICSPLRVDLSVGKVDVQFGRTYIISENIFSCLQKHIANVSLTTVTRKFCQKIWFYMHIQGIKIEKSLNWIAEETSKQNLIKIRNSKDW